MANENKITQDAIELLKKEGVAAQGGTENLYVVYLDDETELLDSVADIMTEFGFKTHCTTSPKSALEFIEKHQYEIAYIISDFKMPEMSGFEFREKVMSISPEVPFSILSANITKDLALKGLDLKITSFIDKSLSPEKFAEVILKDGIARIQALKEDRELLQGFVEEASQNLELAEDLMLALEQRPDDLETVNKCFGVVHTMKGSSGYFKPKTLYKFVHRFEDLLKSIQSGQTQVDDFVVTAVLKSFDFVKVLIAEFKSREHIEYDLEAIFLEYFGTANGKSASGGAQKQASAAVANPGAPAPKAQEKETLKDLRVPIHLLDSFMQTSGEMTVIRNMINKCVKSIELQFHGNKDVNMLSELLEELHEINATTQTQITNLRKVPMHSILKQVPRVVRDVSKTLGKKVEIVTVGDDLAVDTAIAGVLNNSIIHLVRNSLDHGLEGPEEREKQGKGPIGKLTITSSQKNEDIFLTVEDDGRGINETSVRKKLVKNGTHTEAEANALPSKELFMMIFEAGFSTAEKVTDISGRGVGMSMVKDSVTSVGGFIDIESTPGAGSKFTLAMPVPKSVLIRNCLFVVANEMLLGIPQDDVYRVMRVESNDQDSIYHVPGSNTLNYEGQLIPIVKLGSLLEIEGHEASAKREREMLDLVIIGSGKRMMAIEVDSISDIEDTVIKPLQGPTKKIESFQGAAFMGDGNIGLILSSEGLLNRAGITTTHTKTRQSQTESKVAADARKANSSSRVIDLLLFNIGDQSVYAVPSQSINRIEEVEIAEVQQSGGVKVIPYRDQLLTLISLRDILGVENAVAEEKDATHMHTIVIERHGHLLGLTVHSIEDIATTESELIPPISSQFGISGTYLIGEKTVTLVNLDEVFYSIADGTKFKPEGETGPTALVTATAIAS